MTQLSPAQVLAALPAAERAKLLRRLSSSERNALCYRWRFLARPKQLAPVGDWDIWHIEAGRGSGKTRAGAEIVREWEARGVRRIALVARTKGDVRKTMLEGESGLLNIYPPGEAPIFIENKEEVRWRSGAVAQVFSDEKPDSLRGPQFEKAWCDEPSAWPRLRKTWDNLNFGMRLGEHPQIVATCTPKRRRAYKEIFKSRGQHKIIRTGGSSYENMANLSEFYRRTLEKYSGTRLGRQEIDGIFLDQMEGALWNEANLDQHRIELLHLEDGLGNLVISVDPAVSNKSTSAETGIVAAGRTANGHGVVLADRSMRAGPSEWGRAVVQLFHQMKADRVVGEVNNGGDLVEALIHSIDPAVPFKAVHASRGKRIRAEPVAALYDKGLIHHVKSIDLGGGVVVQTHLDDLEDQQVNWDPNHADEDDPEEGGAEMDVASPDRVDALVWGITDLFGSDMHAWEALAEY